MTDTSSHTATNSNFPPSAWVETTLGEVAETNKSSIGKDFKFEEILYLDTGSITENRIESLQKYSISETPSRAKRLVKENDIVYSTVRPIQKHFGFIDNPEKNLVVSTGFTVISAIENRADSKFLYYFLTQDQITNTLQQTAEHSTSTYPSIRPEHIENVKILLPPLPEQQAIASVLSSFDDKIELLREQNKTLEEMGQVIFGEWFGKYGVDDELPAGWRVFELSEIVDIVNGYAYKGSDLVENSNEALVTLKSFDRNGGFQTRGFKPFIGKPKETQEVKIGDLVVAHTDLTQDAEVLGNPAFIFDDGGFDKMYITMDLVKIVSKKENITNAFLYYLMKTKEFKGHCVGYANGTTVLHLSKKAIPEYQIALPENFEILLDVSVLLKETTDKIADINSQIQTLANTRDELLPRLMRGEVRVEVLV